MTPPSRVVFDIETLAFPFDSFDEEQQSYLLKFAKDDSERDEALERLALGPLTARVLAIAMLNPDTGRGQVFYEHPDGEPWSSPDRMIEYVPADEHTMLEEFWKRICRFNQFITFNGRTFDCPFLLLRSALLGVKATRNLMPYRYQHKEHCDLLDQLTFFGASRKYSLDFYCKTFGIPSPKRDGIDGAGMPRLVEEGRYATIAEYCMGDVKATAELFCRWRETIGFEQ